MMNRTLLIFLVVTIILVTTACSRLRLGEDVPAAASPTPSPNLQPVATETTATATPTATIPIPEELQPTLLVEDQSLAEDGQVDIERVITDQDGWLVLYRDEDGQTGEILGLTPIEAGDHENLSVEIDPFETTPIIHARLYVDEGQVGEFEVPGPDRPVNQDGEPVGATFNVELQAITPTLTVSGQEFTPESAVVIDEVITPKPGWLVLQLDEAGDPGALLAYTPIAAGRNSNISMPINWREATPQLHAFVYEDLGEQSVFEFQAEDRPLTVNGEPVEVVFELRLPPDIFVIDQPVIRDTIEVERAISYGPGWVVIYNDSEDELFGNIIGWAPLADGINTRIPVTVTESAVTPFLYAMLHEDLEAIGEFGFPRTDPPIRYQGRMPDPATFRTDPGNYLITRDQPITASGTLTVPLVIVDENAWLVIRQDNAGEVGEIIGRTWVQAGLNRDVEIDLEVDPDQVSQIVYAVLHLDAGFSRIFEYPNGLDIPFQRNRNIIQAPFAILEDPGE